MALSPGKSSVVDLLNRCTRRPPDEAAWEEFVRRYHMTIRSNVIKTFNKKSQEEADRKPQFPEDLTEDLVQAVYVRLVEEGSNALTRFEGEYENSIYQYLAMISINVVRDYFREVRAQKRPKISFSLDELLESTGDGALGDAISSLDGSQLIGSTESFTMDEIDSALKKVASGKNRDRDIAIFKLRYYEGLTLEEITKTLQLDISAISVGSILNRMIKKLLPLLDPSGRKR